MDEASRSAISELLASKVRMLCPLISIVNNILFKIRVPAMPRLTYQNLRSFWLPPRHTRAVIFPRMRLISSRLGEEPPVRDSHHSASRARIMPRLFGFLTLIQSRDGNFRAAAKIFRSRSILHRQWVNRDATPLKLSRGEAFACPPIEFMSSLNTTSPDSRAEERGLAC